MILYIVIFLLIADLVVLALATGAYATTHSKHSSYRSTDDLMSEKGLFFCWSGLLGCIANAGRKVLKKDTRHAERYVTKRGEVLLKRIQWVQAIIMLLAVVLMFCLALVLEGQHH